MRARRRRIEPTIGNLDSIDLGERPRRPAIPRREPRCPLGVRLIAWLAVLGGFGGIVVVLVAYQPLAAGFDSSGIHAGAAYAQWIAFFVLAATAGALALGANKAGWALLVVLLAFEAVMSVQALAAAYDLGIEVSVIRGRTLSPYAGHGARLLLDVSFAAYLLSPRAREFFGLAPLTAWAFVSGVGALATGSALMLSSAGLA